MQKRPWMFQQNWNDVLFIHWPVPYVELRPHVPESFKLETYDGYAWIGIVLFQATNSRLRGMPSAISYRSFLQLNVRTYVQFAGKPGVYFFSLDANSKLAVAGARTIFSLPYLNAQMKLTRMGNSLLFESQRTHKDVTPATISVRYQPTFEAGLAKRNSLPYFLTERYCLWEMKGKKILKNPISHRPWPLQSAELDIKMSGLIPFLPKTYFVEKPIVFYTKFKKAHLHPFEVQ